MTTYGESVKDFRVGQRVGVHPATNTWLSGQRYGEVVLVGRKLVHVKLDRTGRIVKFAPIWLAVVV